MDSLFPGYEPDDGEKKTPLSISYSETVVHESSLALSALTYSTDGTDGSGYSASYAEITM